MNLERIDEHTLDVDLLGPGSVVLDIGCRGFGLARYLAAKGCKVLCFDPSPDVEDPHVEGIIFERQAVLGYGIPGATVPFALVSNKNANFVADGLYRPGQIIEVPTTTIPEIMAKHGIGTLDAVKLDCEGSEYEILGAWPGKIAKQISVEFHLHTHSAKTQSELSFILNWISQWYDVVQHELSLQHGLPTPNYWDSLFVLNGSR